MALVAIFDILGFRQLSRRLSLEKLVGTMVEVVRTLEIATIAPEPTALRSLALSRLPAKDFKKAHAALVHPKCEFGFFSDTLILFSEATTQRAVESFLTTAATALTAFMARGIAVRGAITKGPLFADVESNVYLGRALVEAYDLEQSQDWAGAVVDPKLMKSLGASSRRRLLESGTIMRYRVPFKASAGVTRRWRFALGWPLGLVYSKHDLRQLFNNVNPPKGPSTRKLGHAIDFYVRFQEFHEQAPNHRFLRALSLTAGR